MHTFRKTFIHLDICCTRMEYQKHLSFFRKRDAEKCGFISEKQRSLPVGKYDARLVQPGTTAIDNH
jgi:hypothetical protein